MRPLIWALLLAPSIAHANLSGSISGSASPASNSSSVAVGTGPFIRDGSGGVYQSTSTDNTVFSGTVTFRADVQAPGSTVTFNASQTINWQTQGPTVRILLTGNVTGSTWSNPIPGGKYTLILIQDPTGSRTFAWPAGVVFPNKGAAPALTTTAGARDYFSLIYDADFLWHVLAEALNN